MQTILDKKSFYNYTNLIKLYYFMNINEYIISQLLKKIPAKNQNEYFLKLKREASKKFGLPNPTNIEILGVYRKMVKNKKIKPNKNIENLLITKNVRTLSGVAVVAVLTKPYACPGTCVYCPTEKDMPKSYLSNEPAVMRAILTDFHPYKQVVARLKSLEATGHKTDKIELIINYNGRNFFVFSETVSDLVCERMFSSV
jgi:elongator complex protein 3